VPSTGDRLGSATEPITTAIGNVRKLQCTDLANVSNETKSGCEGPRVGEKSPIASAVSAFGAVLLNSADEHGALKPTVIARWNVDPTAIGSPAGTQCSLAILREASAIEKTRHAEH
jgi:hypothetical protein